MSELLAALFGAVVGAGATYILDVHKAAAERRQQLADDAHERHLQREILATALLSDLQRLEISLRQIYGHSQPYSRRVTCRRCSSNTLLLPYSRFSAGSVHPTLKTRAREGDVTPANLTIYDSRVL